VFLELDPLLQCYLMLTLGIIAFIQHCNEQYQVQKHRYGTDSKDS
jgi:hypothetical protein